MKKRNIIRISIITILLTGSLAVLQTFGKAGQANYKNASSPSCEKNSPTSNGIIWESLSNQFSIS